MRKRPCALSSSGRGCSVVQLYPRRKERWLYQSIHFTTGSGFRLSHGVNYSYTVVCRVKRTHHLPAGSWHREALCESSWAICRGRSAERNYVNTSHNLATWRLLMSFLTRRPGCRRALDLLHLAIVMASSAPQSNNSTFLKTLHYNDKYTTTSSWLPRYLSILQQTHRRCIREPSM